MLIRKFAAGCESGSWVAAVPEARRSAAEGIHQAFVKGDHRFYSLADRVRVYALTRGLEPVEDLAEERNDLG